MFKKSFLSVMALAWMVAGMQAGDVAMLAGSQMVTGNKTFSGALVSTGTFSAMNSVSLKGYTVDSFAASLLTSTSAGDIRSKLGLGGAAVLNVGSASGTVAAGNDSRLVNAVQQSGAATLSSATFSSSVNIYMPATYLPGFLVSGSGDGSNMKFYDVTNTSVPSGSRRWYSAVSTADGNLYIRPANDSLTGDSAGLTLYRTGTSTPARLALGGIADDASYIALFGGSVKVATGSLAIVSSGYGVAFASGAKILSGSGSPESAVTAPVGSLYLRSDGGAGTSLYVKQSGSGNTGWVGK